MPEQAEPCLAMYRGWMLKPSTYGRLYEALAAKGLRLVNDPAAYVHCHHLPESYSAIEDGRPVRLAEDRGRGGHGPDHGAACDPSGRHRWC